MKIPPVKSSKFLALLAISAIIGSAIYIYSGLNTAKAYTFFAPINTFVGKKIIEPIKKAAISGKTSVENKLKQASADLIKETVESAKNNAFISIKNGLDSGLNAIGKTIGVDEKIINQEQNNQSTEQENNNCNCSPK